VSYMSAIEDFRQARRQAALERILARLRGRSAELLAYEEVRDKLRAGRSGSVSLREIPIDAIIGSVGRYADFSRSFLPLQSSIEERWARVQMAVHSLEGLPPIDVYQIGDAYFVRDGNHRVSVARSMGATQIQAHVTEIETRVPLTPDVEPGDLILKAEYVRFLEETHLDELRPGADLTVTVPGQYDRLLEQIGVHRYFMGQAQGREIPFREAAAHWYDQVYLPVVEAIRERGILRDFPNRTEADLYLWVADHRAALAEALGWEVEPDEAAADLAARWSSQAPRILARLGERLRKALTPGVLEGGPSPGQWRTERLAPRQGDRLFADILVAISGGPAGWQALDQALEVARQEGSRLRGLHVVSSAAAREAPATQALIAEFSRRCQAAGVPGHLVVDVGRIAPRICDRSHWCDLVVVQVAYPPGSQLFARLGSGLRTLVTRCPTPVLAVPRAQAPLRRALLAYDGSRKADEALFVGAYLAGRWGLHLTVVAVMEDGRVTIEALDRAHEYLESRNVEAVFVQERGPVGQALVRSAEEDDTQLILLGGYGHGPVLEAVLGSAVDQMLRHSRWPMLICR
jgi:nucleotide-binding universal stress UspA family protein